MKVKSIYFIFIELIMIFALNFAGCKKDNTPTTPIGEVNEPMQISDVLISANYFGENLMGDVLVIDAEKDNFNNDTFPTFICKIVDVSGVFGSKIVEIKNDPKDYLIWYSTTDKNILLGTRMPAYDHCNIGSEILTNSNCGTGQFTITFTLYDPIHKNTGISTISGIIEMYETKAKVFDGVNTPVVRISNEDYFQWSNGLTEYDLGGSPHHWQKNTTNSSGKNLVANNFNSDTDTSMSQTYNDSDIWQDFVDAIKTGNYHVTFDRYDHTSTKSIDRFSIKSFLKKPTNSKVPSHLWRGQRRVLYNRKRF